MEYKLDFRCAGKTAIPGALLQLKFEATEAKSEIVRFRSSNLRTAWKTRTFDFEGSRDESKIWQDGWSVSARS